MAATAVLGAAILSVGTQIEPRYQPMVMEMLKQCMLQIGVLLEPIPTVQAKNNVIKQ